MSWRCFCKTSWKRIEEVFKTSWQDVLKTSWRHLESVLKASWKRFEDVLKTYDQDDYIGFDQDVLKTSVLKTSSEDVWVRRIYSSWSRRLEASWRRFLKTKTKNVFKTFSRRLHQDGCLLGCFLMLFFYYSSATTFVRFHQSWKTD